MKEQSQPQEGNNVPQCSCGVPSHLHGTACGWINATYIVTPQNDEERLWQSKWNESNPNVIYATKCNCGNRKVPEGGIYGCHICNPSAFTISAPLQNTLVLESQLQEGANDHLLYKLDLKVSDLLSHPENPIQQPEQPKEICGYTCGCFLPDQCKFDLNGKLKSDEQPVKKPLSEITDEDVKELQKILKIDPEEAGFDCSPTAIKISLIEDGVDGLMLCDFYGHFVKAYQYLEQQGYELPRYYPQPVQPVKEEEKPALSETLLIISRLIRSMSILDSKYELESFHKKRLDEAKYILQKYSDPKDALRHIKQS